MDRSLNEWNEMQVLSVKANGICFEVFTRGDGDRVALCLHGFPEHAISWRYQVPLLLELGYRVWIPNLRGYGETDAPQQIEAYDLEVLIADVEQLAVASGARELLLLAHDWGGVLAWCLAMRRPELIHQLIICNMPHPACFLRELRKPAQLLKSWYFALFQIPRLPEFLYGLRRRYGIGATISWTAKDRSAFSEAVLNVYRDNAARPGRLTAMLNWYRAMLRTGGARRLARAGVPRIEIPTLLLWGTADVALSIRTLDGTEEYVSSLSIETLPGVSHWIQQEAHEPVNRRIRAWICSGRSGASFGSEASEPFCVRELRATDR